MIAPHHVPEETDGLYSDFSLIKAWQLSKASMTAIFVSINEPKVHRTFPGCTFQRFKGAE